MEPHLEHNHDIRFIFTYFGHEAVFLRRLDVMEYSFFEWNYESQNSNWRSLESWLLDQVGSL